MDRANTHADRDAATGRTDHRGSEDIHFKNRAPGEIHREHGTSGDIHRERGGSGPAHLDHRASGAEPPDSGASRNIYVDHAATTPLDPRVREAMLPYLGERFGNPSSLHQPGRRAREAVEKARQQVADLFNATPEEVTFTASGTEADNLALRGLLSRAADPACGRLITSAIEHPAVLETARALAEEGVPISLLPVDGEGVVRPEELARRIVAGTRLVSVMAANNVTGVLQPIRELAAVAHAHGAYFHTDAVQAAGKVPIDLRSLGLDLISASAHKLHGPQGVGALVVAKGVPLAPLIRGGGQERGLRSATENVAGLVGFGRAAEIARAEMTAEAVHLVSLRKQLLERLAQRIPHAVLLGNRFRRLPGHVCLRLLGQEGDAIKLLLALDERGIAVSSGSACSAHHAGESSYVLQAMGLDPIAARGSLRITLGRFNTREEIERLVQGLEEVVRDLRPITTRGAAGPAGASAASENSVPSRGAVHGEQR